jgi:tetratricopeptide (TPR) repeat protein
MGEVWKAWDTKLGRWVALKFPRCETPSVLARLKDEAAALGHLAHPNLAAVYGFGEANGRHFIAMQYVEGATLARYPRKDRRKLIAFVRYAALGVACAHEHGIVHRDLKPSNLMVDRRRERVYVLDFGISRPVSGDGHATAVVGTPAYMSPEQARGTSVDGRSDVYSLAATLYELMADRPPFDGPHPAEILRQVLSEHPRPLRHVDADLNAILMKGLEKDPSRRYASVAEFADDLHRYLRGKPVLAHPPGWLGRLRRRWTARGASALSTLGLGAAIVALWLLSGSWLRERALRGDRTPDKQRVSEAARPREEERTPLFALWSRVVLAKRGWYQAHRDPAQTRATIDAAVGELTRHVSERPDQPHVYYVRARAWLYLDELGKAQSDLKRAIEIEPDFSPAWTLLGRVNLEQYRETLRGDGFHPSKGETDLLRQASVAFENARRSEAESGAARRWGLERMEEEEIAETITRAMAIAYVEQDVPRARETLAEAHAQSPSEDYLNLLGHLAEDPPAAVVWQTRALDLRPHYPTALLDRGLARLRSKDAAGAVADFTAALKIHPGLAAAYALRAHAREELFEYAGTIEDATEAIRRGTAPVGALTCRSWARWKLGDRRGAVADLSEAIEHRPDDAHLYFYRGSSRLALQDLDGAAQDAALALKLAPGLNEARRLQEKVERQRQAPKGSE